MSRVRKKRVSVDWRCLWAAVPIPLGTASLVYLKVSPLGMAIQIVAVGVTLLIYDYAIPLVRRDG